jgi:hypothetical protein
MAEETSLEQGSKHGFSRRDFLKVAGAGLATVAAVGSGVIANERIIFSNEHKIDMDNYLSKIKVEGRDEWTINFTALRAFFPDVVKESEQGGFVLKNDSEKPVVLDFSNAGGKKIRLFPNDSSVAKSNMSWEKSQEPTGFGLVRGGLFLEGAFTVKGNIGREPVFVGDVLDRVISFKGNGTETCVVEDVEFKGLNAFKQDQTGGGDCPSPAFIAGDDVNLEVRGIKIDYTPIKPGWADEVNSQLAKGIILHNTQNERPLKLLVTHSVIKGLEWDGVCANGLAEIQVVKSWLFQNRSYKQVRGVGIASTFNSPDGKISIVDSTVDYCKGTSIWVNEQTDLPRKISNLEIQDTAISNAGCAISIDADQKTKIKNLNVSPDYAGGLQSDTEGFPLHLGWKGEKFDLSFENLNFNLSTDMGDGIKLMFFANWDEFANFSNTSPKDFFDKHFGSWGDVSVKLKTDEGKIEEFKLSKQQFADFLVNFKSNETVNPSGMMLWFDTKIKQFVVLFATNLDPQGSMSFSEPYYFEDNINNVPNHGASLIPKTVSKRQSEFEPKVA